MEQFQLPGTAGTYNLVLDDGTTLSAYFSPQSAHWIIDGVEAGFADRIKPLGAMREQRIVSIAAYVPIA